MTTTRDLVHSLVSLRSAIVNELRPKLNDANARDLADHAVLMLNRIIAEHEVGPVIAQDRCAAWEDLEREFHRLSGADGQLAGPVPASDSGDIFGKLQRHMEQLQQRIAGNVANDGLLGQLAMPGSNSARWFRQCVEAACDLHETYEGKMALAAQSSGPQAANDAEQLRAVLSRYLKEHFPELPPDPVLSLTIVPGGRAKRTAIFELKSSSALPTRLVLRCDLAVSQTGTKAVDEFPLLQELYQTGLPVPEPILAEQDSSRLGGTFMIVGQVTDAVLAGEHFPEERRLSPSGSANMGPEFGQEIARFLAALHRLRSMPARADGSRPEVESPRDELQRMYEIWHSISKPPLSIIIDLGYAWLMSHPLPANRPRCVVHGDFGCHNILTRNGSLRAVLDWELAHEGDPARDFGDCRSMLLDQLMPWDEFVKAYVGAGGDPRACDPLAVSYFGVLRFVKHGTMCALLRHYFFSGARTDVLAAGTSWHYPYRLQQYCARELKRAIDLHQVAPATSASASAR